jgi:hypothetical protein
MVLAQPIAQVIPSMLKVAVSGFTAAIISFFVVVASAEASAVGSLAVFLQLTNSTPLKVKARNVLVKFIDIQFKIC